MRAYLSTRKEVLLFALVVMLITCVPYLIGFQAQGSDWSYTGFVIGVEDGNSYLSKMLSGSYGDWLFRSKHSTFPQRGVLAYFPYILLGKLAAGAELHTQLIAIYHIFRFIAGFLAIAASYELISFFVADKRMQWWALVLTTLGGGVGWVLVAISQKGILGSLPLDFISPESFGFIGLLGFPHLAAARALFVWGLFQFLVKKNGYAAGIAWLVMGLFQPMVGLVAWSVIGSYTAAVFFIARRKEQDPEDDSWKDLILRFFRAFILSAPLIIYTVWIFLTDPYFIAWNEQNKFLSPHPLHYLFAYGLVLPFAALGTRRLIQDGQQKGIFLLAWLVTAPFLIYAPVVSQRRLAEGLWICLVIGMMCYFDGRKVPRLMPVVWSLLLPTSLFLLAGSVMEVLEPGKPLFRPQAEVAAFEKLGEIALPGAGVLSSFEVGNNLPARVPMRSVIGHGPETIDLSEIQNKLNEYFYHDLQSANCSAFFADLGADYLFWGPVEQRIWKIDTRSLGCLREIYNSGDYHLFEIQ